MEKCGRARQATDDNIIRRMRLVCWITRYRHPHAICNTCCFSTATMVTRTRQCYVICILPGLIFVFNTKTRSIFSFTCCRGMSNNTPLFSVTYIIKTTALTPEIPGNSFCLDFVAHPLNTAYDRFFARYFPTPDYSRSSNKRCNAQAPRMLRNMAQSMMVDVSLFSVYL